MPNGISQRRERLTVPATSADATAPEVSGNLGEDVGLRLAGAHDSLSIVFIDMGQIPKRAVKHPPEHIGAARRQPLL